VSSREGDALTMKRRDRLAAVGLAIALAAGASMYFAPGLASMADRSASATPGPAAVNHIRWTDDETTEPEAGLPQANPQGTRSPPSPTSPGRGTPGRRTLAKSLPDGTVQVGRRYLENYRARRVSWDDVIDRGRSFPSVSERCADRWRTSGKDARLNWESADFLCLNALEGRGYRPQGIGGSATAEHYLIGAQPAADRNIVLTSWYSRAREPGLLAQNRSGESVTRLVVMDMDQGRYNSVELVRPSGRDTFRNLNSHGSGLVWAGQYLYSSSRSALWMYNADDILEIDGRFVLPAVARWTVNGSGGLSSISLDRSATPHQLKGIDYTKDGQAYIQSFSLTKDGSLASTDVRAPGDMVLENEFGDQRRAVRSVSSIVIPGTSYQGVGSSGPYTFANSSSLKLPEGPRKSVDATVVLKDGAVIKQFRMPYGNGQSVYVDYQRGMYTSLNERGSQFLFSMPLEQMIEAAER
jgi:hypothetical protein